VDRLNNIEASQVPVAGVMPGLDRKYLLGFLTDAALRRAELQVIRD